MSTTTCTCPSGDGSLRWPCPAHPPELPQAFLSWTAAMPPEVKAWLSANPPKIEMAAQGVPAGWKLAGYLYDLKDNGVTIPDWFTSRKAEAEAPGHFNVRNCYTPAPATETTPEDARMTSQRAAFFMDRFLREEKMLGPNEQAALRFVIAQLEATPPQAQQAAPLTVPHPGSPEASAMIDSELAARGWPSNTKNAARAGYEACRKLAGIGVSSGSAA